MILSDIQPESKDLVRILFTVINRYGHAIHTYLFRRYLDMEGYSTIGSEREHYNNIFGTSPVDTVRSRVKCGLLNLREDLRYGRRGSKALNVGSDLWIKDRYARREGLFRVHRSPCGFLKPAAAIPAALIKDIEYMLNVLDEAGRKILDRCALTYGIEYNASGERLLAELKETTARDLIYAMKIYLGTRSYMGNAGYDHFLADNLGNAFNRTLLVSARSNGMKVVGFTHGNYTGVYNDIGHILVEFMIITNYVTTNRGTRPFFEGVQEEYSDYICRDKVAVESVDDGHLLKLWNKQRRKPVPKGIKKIMIVEPAYSPYFTLYHGALYYSTQLDLTLRIAETLKKKGYYVMLKSRPECLNVTENGKIYEGLVDECVGGYFENAYDAADAIIFTHLHSTAFGFSLASKKKIIYFIYEKDKYIQDKLDILNKRCEPVNCWFDEANRIAFKEEDLLGSLETKDRDINTEFMERYLFP